jgi:prepilin-type N-terminal cleavage/methylation domain-containing protein
MTSVTRRRIQGFSLIELVIVVVIIAIIGAIAIPRMSRGAAGASDSAVVANLATLRNAIDLYATEHGGTFPAADKVNEALTQYTDAAGDVKADKDDTHIFGPYLRAVPPLPVGAKKGNTVIGADGAVAGVGWVYTAATGKIIANAADAEKDSSAKAYKDY